MQQETNLRNLIFAMVAIAGVMLITQIFVWGPEQEAAKERAAAQQTEQSADSNLAPGPVDGSALDSTENSNAVARAQQDVRVPFEGPAIDGSLLLRGARVDHLRLKEYYQTLEDKEAENPEGEVTVFQPQATGDGFYASVGWLTGEGNYAVDPESNWTLSSGTTLTPDTPIELTFSGNGLSLVRKVEIDENYMFTFTDTVTNTSGQELAVQPYGVLRQFGMPEDLANFYILHEGLIAAAGGELKLFKYNKNKCL